MVPMTTSDDRALSILHALLQICEDSAAGYETAAQNVPDAKLWREFEPYRKQRQKIVRELQQRIRDLRGDPTTAPSGASALHRAWMQIRTMADANPNNGVLVEVERGEAFAVEAYRQALKEHDIDATTRRLLEHHYELVQAAHDRVQQLLDRTPAARG